MLLSLVQTQAAAQRPQISDSALLDSVVVTNPPVPDPVAKVLQFFFHVPQWLQIGGAIVGALVVIALLVFLWKKRMALWGWLVSRSQGVKAALASAAGIVLLAFAVLGFASFDYMENDNDFCTGCHVMTPAVTKFAESEHSKLKCHDCHRQSIFASARQLFLWVVDRPEEIGKHAPVPNAICSECHNKAEPDSAWERIAGTAGHRVHLESDSSALKDVQCVTCHGAEVHRFVPVDQTCAQSGCHDDIEIRLAKMRDQTDLHCTVCHEFTRPVSEQISVDSARRTMVPRQAECFSCHEMREAVKELDPKTEPHGASCGSCHNPHEQDSPKAAFQTCTNAGCHSSPRDETPFHKTVAEATLEDCESCHEAHTWEVKPNRCLDCHGDIFSDRPRARGRSAQRGDSAGGEGMRQSRRIGSNVDFGGGPPRAMPATLPAHGDLALLPASYGGGGADADVRFSAMQATAPRTQAAASQQGIPRRGGSALDQPFSHRRHRGVECSACHQSTGDKHGRLIVNTPRECQSCHHANNRTGVQAADAGGRNITCATCHQPSELGRETKVPATMKLAVSGQTRTRELPFRHAQHRDEACGTCHTEAVTLAPTKECSSCHAPHHEADATCRSCHEAGRQAHTVEAHLGCGGAGCHDQARLTEGLRETRNVCMTCHQEMLNHKPGRECATCHQVRWLAGRGGRTD